VVGGGAIRIILLLGKLEVELVGEAQIFSGAEQMRVSVGSGDLELGEMILSDSGQGIPQSRNQASNASCFMSTKTLIPLWLGS
jgi:hypothetical protein